MWPCISCVSLVLLTVITQLKSQLSAVGPSSDGAIRLVRDGATSPDYTSGVVQVWWNGQWGNICDRSDGVFGSDEADVICHHLGWSGVSDYTTSQFDSYSDDAGPTSLYSLNCPNYKYLNVFQCNYSTYYSLSCSNDTDVSVTCYSTRIWDSPYDGQIRLQRGTYSNQGLVEVYCNGEWGTICDDDFGSDEATVVCRQLGYDGYYDYDHLSITGNSSQSIWLDNVNCASSSYNCIAKCASCPSAEYHNCGHNEDVTIECDIFSSTFSQVTTTNSTCMFAVDKSLSVLGAIIGGIVGVTCLLCLCPFFCICVACASLSKWTSRRTTTAGAGAVAVIAAQQATPPPSYPLQPTTYPQQPPASTAAGEVGTGYPRQQFQSYPPQQHGYSTPQDRQQPYVPDGGSPTPAAGGNFSLPYPESDIPPYPTAQQYPSGASSY